MATYGYWFVLALILMALEMATGTFYLLIMAIAIAIGGVAGLLGFMFTTQLTLAALGGITGIILLLRWKRALVSVVMNQSLDIGQPVKILTWYDDETARVFYRGTEWNAELETKDDDRERALYIKDIRGSVLVLTNRKTV